MVSIKPAAILISVPVYNTDFTLALTLYTVIIPFFICYIYFHGYVSNIFIKYINETFSHVPLYLKRGCSSWTKGIRKSHSECARDIEGTFRQQTTGHNKARIPNRYTGLCYCLNLFAMYERTFHAFRSHLLDSMLMSSFTPCSIKYME